MYREMQQNKEIQNSMQFMSAGNNYNNQNKGGFNQKTKK